MAEFQNYVKNRHQGRVGRVRYQQDLSLNEENAIQTVVQQKRYGLALR